MARYRIAVPPHVEARLRHFPPDIKRGVREALRALALEPGRGEPLKRELQDYMKFRVRRFRIIYRVDGKAREIAVIAIGHRRSVYEETATAMRARSSD